MNIKLISTGNPKLDEAFRNLTSIISSQQRFIDKHETLINSIKVSLGNKLTESRNVKITSEGGLAILLKNMTGADSVKGYVLSVYSATAVNNAVRLITQDVPDAIGAFYESGIPNGNDAWVVVSGIADVYFTGTTVRGYLARGFVAADAGFVAGQATSEAFPVAPFASDKHFYEIGHVLESRTGAGLAKTVLHFN